MIKLLHYYVPRTEIHPEVKFKNRDFLLAYPTFDKGRPIGILIGCELFAKVFTGNNISLGHNLPDAVGTVLGYVIMDKLHA